MLNVKSAQNWFGNSKSGWLPSGATAGYRSGQGTETIRLTEPGPSDLTSPIPDQARVAQAIQLAEAALIARAQTGDQQAFASLVELHQDFVYNLAFHILQDHSEADEAAQEAFVKIWQALPGFRGEAKFTTWAYRIVRNGCLNRLRSAKSGPRFLSVETGFADSDDSEHDLLARLPGEQCDEPAWQFDTQERRRLIWQEVDRLPLKFREIIGMYYGQDMSYEEIAASLDVPVGTVKTHLYRAKNLLREKLVILNVQGDLDFKF